MKRIFLSQILTAAAVLLIGPTAYADLTMKMTMLSSATPVKGKHLTPHDAAIRKDMLTPSGNLEATVYWSNNKIKSVSPTLVTIRDLNSSTQTFLLPESKTKYVASVLLPASMIKQMGQYHQENILDMKKTKTLLGHKVHLFKVYSKNSMMTMTGYVWVAQDIPSPSASGVDTLDSLLLSKHKIIGTALQATLVALIPRYRIKISDIYKVTALSTAPIPMATFAIPGDYKTVPAPGTHVPKPN